jgi:poly(beta-D-mannuronate) lyase
MTYSRVALCLLLAFHAPAVLAKCEPVPQPVVRVSLPSRYTDGSATRSEIDEAENARVNAILAPVDKYVSLLARQTSDALRLARDKEPEKARVLADCVMIGLAAWAKADALSRLNSVNARLAIPSRIGGAAFAYALAAPLASRNEARNKDVRRWLVARAGDTVKFFDDPKTPPRASRNNLRMWAALAVLRIGLTTKDAALTSWSEMSFRKALCTANADGSLPLEMERGPLALHYQLHATAPIVIGVALLQAEGGRDLRKTCNNAASRIVNFTATAIRKPAIASARAGVQQKRITGLSSVEGFELAWIPAWQTLGLSPDLKNYAPAKLNLSNSKLGGNQTLIWEKAKKP